MIYGYARAATGGQSVDAQVHQLWAVGCEKILREIASPRGERPQLQRVLAELDTGDVLMVTRLDRLARSTRDLLNILTAITDRKADFRSLGDAWADTTMQHGRWMLTFLGGVAEFEGALTRARTSEGLARAKATGMRHGRKPKLTPQQQAEALQRRNEGATLKELARHYHVGVATIWRIAS